MPLLDEVLRDGIVVHEGQPGEAALWRSRALMQGETDRPGVERMQEDGLSRLAAGGSAS